MSGGQGLRLSVLGELCASIDGVQLDLGGRRQRAVLAVLVVARGEVVPADRLADAVWGEEAPANTPGALQSYVSHLRKRLEPGAGARLRGAVLVREGNGYAVRLPADAVDAWEVESLVRASVSAAPHEAAELLTRALAMWRGPAYVEYADEPWAEPEAARLAGLRAAARERLFDARLACGQPDLLVPELEAFVAEEPLQEERWRLLVLALYRAQRQADALGALRRARTVLADELGCDPGPALRALEAQVLAQEPSLHLPAPPPAPAAVPAAVPAATPAAVPAQRPPAEPAADLVDRDGELAALRRALDQAARGEPGLVLVEGPAGIGKTRLMTEACREAERRGVTVLTARGTPLERAFGFGAARQLLEPLLRTDADRDRLLTGAAASARGVFEQVEGDAGSFSVLHGLYWLTVNLAATGPVVLAVDDLQWCDSPSLRFLAYLVKRFEELPVLVVATLRTGEQHEDELLCELILDPVAVPLRPGPLGLDATATLVRERLGEPAPAFVQACHHITSGNPLLLRQLLRALEAEATPPDVLHLDLVRAIGSRAVSSLVLLRLRRMPAHVVAAARAVAVLGAAARLPTVAALAELDEPTAAAALAFLCRTEVLRDEQPLAFVHPLVRDAVYGELPAAERALRHERAGHVLQAAGASAEQVGAHLLLAPQRGDTATVAVLQAAARTAVDRGAADTAVTLLRRALEEPAVGPQRLDVLLELGLVETLVDGPAAVCHLQEAWPLLGDPELRGQIAIVLARTHVFASGRGVATAFARDAWTTLPPELDDARQGLLALQRVTGIIHGLDPATYRDGPPPEVRGTGPGARMLAATLSHELVLQGRDRQRAIELSRFALEGDHLLDVDNGLLWVTAAHSLALADVDVGDFWDRADRHAHAQGSLFTALSVSLWRGHNEWLRGDLVDAVQSLRDAVEQDRMWGSSGVGSTYSKAFLVQALIDRGELAEARKILDEADPGAAVGEGQWLLRVAEARLLVSERRPEDAVAVLDLTVDPYGFRNPVGVPERGIRAAALHALGRSAQARDLLEEDVHRLREWGAPAFLGAGLRRLGEVADDVDALREAEALLAGSGAKLERARTQAALGQRLDGPDGTALLRQAHAEALATGAAALRQDVEQLLCRRGVPAPPHRDVAPLTRTQQRAMDLIRQGLDLREVAQRLFLTPGSLRTTLAAATSGAAG